MNDAKDPYPGTESTPQELLVLANQYKVAFLSLCNPMKKKETWLGAPARLCAIHATELYLQALLRSHGVSAKEVRGYCHRLGDMAAHPIVGSLRLRRKTIAHLKTMTDQREYLLVRYAPDRKSELSQMTRTLATLEELSSKVGKAFDDRQRAAVAPAPQTP